MSLFPIGGSFRGRDDGFCDDEPAPRNELIIVLGETYLPGTGGRTIQWHYTFHSEQEYNLWLNKGGLEYDNSFTVYKGGNIYKTIPHGSQRT